jgi:nicotinate-nucleotide adenylyltransferase
MTEPRRIGLFGGSFNPPHVCHLLSSLYFLETTDLDAIWWLPVHRHAFAKDSGLAPWEARLAMAEAAVAPHPRLAVDPIEAELPGRSYTFDTVAELRRRHPGVGFTWIIGSDLLPDLPLWHRWAELREQLRFLVVGRGDGPIPPCPEGDFVVRDFRLPELSSTDLRAAIAAGEPIDAWVPGSVAAWLRAHPDTYAP